MQELNALNTKIQYLQFVKVEFFLSIWNCVEAKIHGVIFCHWHWFPGTEKVLSNLLICFKGKMGFCHMNDIYL